MNLIDYVQKTRVLYPNVRCVCVCSRVESPDGTSFRAYLRIFLKTLSLAWFSIDRNGLGIMNSIFTRNTMTWDQFSKSMVQMMNHGYEWTWMPTNHTQQRYRLLWESESAVRHEYFHDLCDRSMRPPYDDHAYD